MFSSNALCVFSEWSSAPVHAILNARKDSSSKWCRATRSLLTSPFISVITWATKKNSCFEFFCYNPSRDEWSFPRAKAQLVVAGRHVTAARDHPQCWHFRTTGAHWLSVIWRHTDNTSALTVPRFSRPTGLVQDSISSAGQFSLLRVAVLGLVLI